MIPRLAGALAVAGGVAWVVKVAMIWANGGSNTTDGLVGALFSGGAVAIALAVVLRAWHAPSARRTSHRALAVIVALVVFVAAVDLPILVGGRIFGRTWFAEEVSVLITAAVGLVLGIRWLRTGFGRPPQHERPTPEQILRDRR